MKFKLTGEHVQGSDWLKGNNSSEIVHMHKNIPRVSGWVKISTQELKHLWNFQKYKNLQNFPFHIQSKFKCLPLCIIVQQLFKTLIPWRLLISTSLAAFLFGLWGLQPTGREASTPCMMVGWVDFHFHGSDPMTQTALSEQALFSTCCLWSLSILLIQCSVV